MTNNNPNPENIEIPTNWNSTRMSDLLFAAGETIAWCRVFGLQIKDVRDGDKDHIISLIGEKNMNLLAQLVQQHSISLLILRNLFGREWFSDEEIGVIEDYTGAWHSTQTASKKDN